MSARFLVLSARFLVLSARFSAQIPQSGGVAGVKHIELSESFYCPYTYQRGRGWETPSLVGVPTPLNALTTAVMWESFDWPPILWDASALVQEQVKCEREGVLQQAQEWLRQRLLQPVLLPNEGSPA